MSAMMTDDVEMLKGLTLRNPAILKLEESEDEAANLSRYTVRLSSAQIIKAKFILFVNDVERVLPPESLLGVVFNQELCAQLGGAVEFAVPYGLGI
ncbi:hypothetical protein B0H14DRAFT_3452130 [Mycena olivaceomarginata]|nr:hypothetical protein B0H14DRAFT_3452130 [Mycena olivaceomarginata]